MASPSRYDDGPSTSTAYLYETEPSMMDQEHADDSTVPCSNIQELLAINETYLEILDNAINVVEQQLSNNRERQNQLKEEHRLYNRSDVAKRKVPVHLYMPPYFKDENNMCPPMSAEARHKQKQKWFDPLMKEEKKWTPSEIKTLREAVKEAMVAHQVQPLCSRRDIIVSKLRNADITTTNNERRQWTMELEDLMRKISYIKAKTEDEVLTASADYSVVPWNAIANVDFKGTRTEWAVKSKWCNELNPKWNKEPWTSEELEKLKGLRESPKFVSWQLLALALGTNRTSYQCMEKYKTEVSQHSKEWTQDEDTKLIALTKLTSINGHIQWDKVAQFMPGRTRQQVRTRFSHTLDSSVKHGRWTDQEDLVLISAVSRYGAKDWAKVAQAVQNRNDSQCRERWANVLNRSAHINERFTLAEDEQLLYAVKIFGKGNWSKCQILLPKKTARQLRRRYLQLIAAKLRLVAGFSSATEAMRLGRRAPEEDELDKEDAEAADDVPNGLMKEIYTKLANENPNVNESPEEFYKRINNMEKPAAARIRALRSKPEYKEAEKHITEIIKKHKNTGDVDKALKFSQVLKSLRLTDVDIRYMIERSKTLERYYHARQFKKNVDQIGCRVRPIKINIDPGSRATLNPNDSEEEKRMQVMESLCTAIRQHDMVDWGKRFWTDYRFEAARNAKRFAEKMIVQKSDEVAIWKLRVGSNDCGANDIHCPPKTTLPPTTASVSFAKMLQKARAGLNRLSAEHFYPIDTSLDQQSKFTNEDREKLDESRRMNIGLSDEVLGSMEYAQFYARMRTILLEPMRLQIARESTTDETKRLALCLSEDRAHEEEEVSVNNKERPRMSTQSISVTPTSISRVLNNGMSIDTTRILANADKNTAAKIRAKRKIDETVERVAKRASRRNTPVPSHISIDTELDDVDN
uniref:snRNA-activating protein complex subunit 4 n=1 Tax=Caenorhabditis tropicalis TaxID=1561998 RepID=A0A1I7T181_9PELO